MANLPFTTYPLAATGSTRLLSTPSRLAEVQNNVWDFGATGDGSTDDFKAIQNAIDVNSVDLVVATTSPFIPSSAVRATLTTAVSGGALTTLTIGSIGDHYVPGQSYTITLSGGGGTGATAHALANGSGLINNASLVIDTAGTGYSTAPTATIEYPGHVTTITFTSVPSNLTVMDSHIYGRNPTTGYDTGKILPFCSVTSINVGASTATLTARSESPTSFLGDGKNFAVVVNSDLVPGDVVRFCHTNVGTVFFPMGTYRVGQQLSLDGNSRTFNLLGTGKASKIIGNFNNFVLNRQYDPTTGATSALRKIEKLCVENEHATGGGIRLANVISGTVRDCTIIANRGLSTYNQDYSAGLDAVFGSFEMVVENNLFTTGGHRAGSYAMGLFHDGPTMNNHIYDFERGWSHNGGQGGQIVVGNHFELCDVGCEWGITPTGVIFSAAVNAVVGNKFVNCGTACKNPKILLAGNSITGAQGTISGDPQYGILIGSGKMSASLVAANNIAGWFGGAGISFAGGTDSFLAWNNVMGNRVTNTNGSATYGAWRMATTAATARFIENNAPMVYTFANIPPNTSHPAVGPNRYEGRTYNVSNSNTATFGATVTGTGSNHVLVRFNNALDPIVMGK